MPLSCPPLRIPAFFVSVALAASTGGCHVVKKVKQCERISAVMAQNAPALSAPLKEKPSKLSLNEKAHAYQNLIEELKGLPLTDAHVKKERKLLVGQLNQVKKHLIDAGKAITDLTRLETKKEGDREAKVAAITYTPTPPAKKGADKSTPPKADKKEPTKKGSQLTSAQKKKKKIKAKGRTKKPTSLSPQRRYARAKRNIESSAKSINSTIARMEAACR